MNKVASKFFFVLSITLMLGFIFHLLESIFIPFIIAWILAFLLHPLVITISKYIPRWIAIVLLFFLITLIIAGVITIFLPQVEQQIHTFIANMPLYSKRLYHAISIFDSHMKIEPTKLFTAIDSQLAAFGAHIMSVPSRIINTASTFFSLLLDLMIIPIVSFYLLIDWENLQPNFMRFIPTSSHAKVLTVLNRSSYILRRFIHGELLVMLVTGSVYAVGLEFADIPIGLPLAIIAGLVCAIPFASLLLTALPAFVFSLLAADLRMIVIVMITIFIAEFLNNLVLTPVLVGKYVKIHPAVALLLILSSGVLYGITGMVLALPIAAIISYEFLGRDAYISRTKEIHQ